ncbi:hypothetical protein Tco_0276089 [Tanacetum coccineum]
MPSPSLLSLLPDPHGSSHHLLFSHPVSTPLPVLYFVDNNVWKSRIMRYIATKPNHKQLRHFIDNVPYEYQMATSPAIPAIETNPAQDELTELETYDTLGADKKNLIDAEAEVVQIIPTGIENDIYSTIDVCPNAKEMWKSI